MTIAATIATLMMNRGDGSNWNDGSMCDNDTGGGNCNINNEQ